MISTIFAADNLGGIDAASRCWAQVAHLTESFCGGSRVPKTGAIYTHLEYQENGLTQLGLRTLLSLFGQLRTNEIGDSIGISCR